jgi:hypothetical protein
MVYYANKANFANSLPERLGRCDTTGVIIIAGLHLQTAAVVGANKVY